jgi:MFS family permease
MGFFIKKYHKRLAIVVILSLALLTSIYFWWLTQTDISYSQLVLAVLSIWGVYGMASVFIYTYAMDQIRDGLAGTDFTIQIVITHLGSMILAVLSGMIAHKLGYKGLFGLEIIINVLLLITLPRLYKETKELKNQDDLTDIIIAQEEDLII